MKKILALLLAAAMLFCFAGCKNGKDTITTQPNTSGAAQTNINVSAFFYDYSDTYIASVRSALQTGLDTAGIAYTFYDGASDQATQTEQVDTAIAKGADLLIVNIVTTGSDEAAQNVVDAAADKGIPIIFFNREISDNVVKSYDKCCFVGTDADEAGYMQGDMIANFLKTGDNFGKYDLNDDGKISYIMFRGELGNAEAYGRTKYSVTEANKVLAAAGKLTPSAANQNDTTQEADGISPYYLYGNWSASKAKDLMDTALTTYSLTNGDIELIIANNDDQALGAIESLNEKGYNTGTGTKYIPVFGVDATTAAVDAIDSGKMSGTVKQDAQAMANCIVYLTKNVGSGADLMANTSSYNVDQGVDKIRIPYALYTG